MRESTHERRQPQPQSAAESWARAENRTALAELQEQLHALEKAATDDRRDDGRPSSIWRLARAVRGQLDTLRARIIHDFAAPRGWRLARADFSFAQLKTRRPGRNYASDYTEQPRSGSDGSLAFDHPWHFRLQTRPFRPAGIVVHVYSDTLDECRGFARKHALAFEPLDWSWYYPGGCRAGVFTRDPS